MIDTNIFDELEEDMLIVAAILHERKKHPQNRKMGIRNSEKAYLNLTY